MLDNLTGFGGQIRPPAGWPETKPEPEDLSDGQSPKDLTEARRLVAGLLGPTPIKVDDLTRRCQLSAAAVQAVLLELELSGQVTTLTGNRVALLTDPGIQDRVSEHHV